MPAPNIALLTLLSSYRGVSPAQHVLHGSKWKATIWENEKEKGEIRWTPEHTMVCTASRFWAVSCLSSGVFRVEGLALLIPTYTKLLIVPVSQAEMRRCSQMTTCSKSYWTASSGFMQLVCNML